MDAKRLQKPESDNAVDERRGEPRFGSAKTVTVMPCASAHPEQWEFSPAMVEDVSDHGIRIITELPLQQGDEFFVKVRHGGVTLAQYTVRHCTECAEGRYQIGANLTGCIGTGDPDAIVEYLRSE